MKNNMLTEINEGNSHENNKYGGVPMGLSSNGKQNTVEQNETIKNNFVYSDRLYINEDLAKAMNLPGYIKGKSFASASKAINDKFKDRNDIHTKATQKELLDRLAQSQEQLKAEQEAINRSMQINQSEVEYPEETQQFEGGGFMDFIKNNGGSISDVGGQIGTMMNPGGIYQSQLKKANEVGYEDTHLQKSSAYNQGLDQIQGMVGKAFGPVGEAVVGTKRLGENIGGAIGGDVGAGVSSLFSPEKAAIANWTDKDMKFGDKLLGQLPVVGGIKANNSAEKRLKKFQDNKNRANSFYKYQFNENNDDTQVFAKGGPLDGGNPEDTFPNGIYAYNEKEASDAQGMMYKRHNNMSGIPYADNGLLVSKRFPQIRDRATINSSEDFQRVQDFTHPDNNEMMIRRNSYRSEDPSYINPNNSMQKSYEYGFKGRPSEAYKEWVINNKNNKGYVQQFQRHHNLDNPNGIQLKEDGVLGPASYTAMGLRTDGTEFPIRLNADKALESALSTPDSEVKPDYTLDDIKNMESSYNATVKNKKPFDFKQVSDKFGNALRYAPILGNILQKNKIGPAEVESAIKNPYQYKKQYIDEAQYRNAADQQAALSMEALNKSGLSGNQLMAASLGTQLQRTKGVAEGAMAAKMHNLNENKIAEQVKQQNEGDYVSDSRLVRDNNAQNRANRDTQISKFDSEIYNSLGEIGKEELFKKQAEKLTGYKMMGEYMMADPNYKSQYEAIQKDSKLTPKEKYAKEQKLIQEYYKGFDSKAQEQVSNSLKETATAGHAYGGYMSPKFKKY